VKTLIQLSALLLVAVQLGAQQPVPPAPGTSAVPRRVIRSDTNLPATPPPSTRPVLITPTTPGAGRTNPVSNITTTVTTTTNVGASVTATQLQVGTPALPLPPRVNTTPAATPPVPGQPVIAQPAPVPVPVPGQPALTPPPTTLNAGAAPGAPNLVPNPDEEVFPPGLIKFQDADLLQVLEVYQELTGRTVLRPNNLPATKISIKSQTQLTRREAIAALDSILGMNQITMVPQGEKFVKAVPQAQAGQEAAEFNELPAEAFENTGRYVTEIVQIKNQSPQDVVSALTPLAKMPQSIMAIPSSGILVLRDYEENVKRMLELIEKIDVIPIQEFESVVIPIKYALAGDIATVIGSLTSGGGGVTSVGQRQQGAPSRLGAPGARGGSAYGGAASGGYGGAGYGGGGYGGGGGYNPYGDVTPMATVTPGVQRTPAPATTPGGGTGTFADRLRNIVNRASGSEITVLGDTKIIADERTNSLLIFANKSDLMTISNIIEKLDVVLAQVLIEAFIIEVSLGDELRYGFSYAQRRSANLPGGGTGFGGIFNPPTPIFGGNIPSGGGGTNGSGNLLSEGFSYFTTFNDFEANFTALAKDSRINVLSRPRVQTSHAVPCRIFVGETRPYVSGSFGYIGSSQSIVQQLRIGIELFVTPLINPEGLVVMEIEQRVDAAGRDVIIDGNAVPTTTERSANATVSVRDGETIMIGGFISNTKNTARSGVPILKDIPIIGPLFRSTSDNNDRKELILMIRPSVLKTPEEAAQVAIEEKARMPGVAEAEREMREEERKQIRRSAKELYKREGYSQ
jgi:general secretion pathway protein D